MAPVFTFIDLDLYSQSPQIQGHSLSNDKLYVYWPGLKIWSILEI